MFIMNLKPDINGILQGQKVQVFLHRHFPREEGIMVNAVYYIVGMDMADIFQKCR